MRGHSATSKTNELKWAPIIHEAVETQAQNLLLLYDKMSGMVKTGV
jgi:hypothetical protein